MASGPSHSSSSRVRATSVVASDGAEDDGYTNDVCLLTMATRADIRNKLSVCPQAVLDSGGAVFGGALTELCPVAAQSDGGEAVAAPPLVRQCAAYLSEHVREGWLAKALFQGRAASPRDNAVFKQAYVLLRCQYNQGASRPAA